MKPLFTSLLVMVLFTMVSVQNSFAQFTGDFDHANWQTSASSGTVDASVDQLSLTGGNDGQGTIEYSITVNSDQLISFDWEYTTADSHPQSDHVYYKVDDSWYILNNSSSNLSQSGWRSVFLESGSTFSFIQYSNGCCGVASTVISNFTQSTPEQPIAAENCSDGGVVVEGETNLTATTTQYGIWHSFTMPDEEDQKLVIEMPASTYVYVYKGSCNNYQYISGGFRPKVVVSGFLPNDNVQLLFYSYINEPAFGWRLTVDDTEEGESCAKALQPVIGTNQAIVTDPGNPIWYSYTMPEDGKVKIISNAGDDVQIQLGTCESNYTTASGYNNIEIVDLEPGESFFINWSTYNAASNFDWELVEEDLQDGDVCGSALPADVGENQYNSDGGDVWFTFTMPDELNKKLVITSDINGPVYVRGGTCESLSYYNSAYGDISVGNASPGEQLFIQWYTNNAAMLSWNIAIEDLAEGESCGMPMLVNLESENLAPQTSLGESWNKLIMPEGEAKKLIISTTTNTSFQIYTGSCDDLNYLGYYFQTGEIADLAPGEHVLIKWNTSQDNFPFNVAFEDYGPGESCSSAVGAVVGDNHLVANGLISHYYSFTMPVNAPNRLSVTSNVNFWVSVIAGSCAEPVYVTEGYGEFNSDHLLPGQSIVIRWDVNEDSNFIWQLALEEVEAGESCGGALEATLGINNASDAPKWFTYRMPGTGDITISSVGLANNDTYLRVYDGCGGNLLGQSDDYSGLQSQLEFNDVQEGTIFKILWDDTYSSDGFDWSLQLANVSQTIVFNAIEAKAMFDEPFDLNATTNSSLPITYTSSNENVATIQGNTVTIVGIGSTTITASQDGNESFNAAIPVEQVLEVGKATQSISFAAIPNKTIEDADFQLSASSTADLPIIYESSNPAVATISDNTVTIIGTGSTTITASQAGNDFYGAAISVMRTLTITKILQSITFDLIPDKQLGDGDFLMVASASSGLPVSFQSTNVQVLAVNGNLLSIVGPGKAVVIATQAGDNNYEPISAEQEVTVTSDQSISFEILTPKTFGDASFQLAASSTSGLDVMFESSDPAIASVNGKIVTIHHAGLVDIKATQQGNEIYTAADEIVQTLVINRKDQQISFGEIESKTLGDAPFQITATSNASLPVILESSDPTIAQITDNTISLLKAGSVTIAASQEGNTDFLPADPVTQTFCINPAKPTISANFDNEGAPVLTSSSSQGNQWYRNGQAIAGATGNSHTVTAAGEYTIKTTAGICSSNSSEPFAVVVTDIPQPETEVKVYPNPASDYMIVPGTDEHSRFEVIGTSGMSFRVNSEWIKSSQHTKVTVSELPSGFYSLLIRKGINTSRVKFIKK